MGKTKVFLLIPDGIGLRNFAFTEFPSIASSENLDLIYWNNIPLDLEEYGFKSIKISSCVTHPFTETLKKARKEVELNLNSIRNDDSIYDVYRFKNTNASLKGRLKAIIVKGITKKYTSYEGWSSLRRRIEKYESTTAYYKECYATLKKEVPSIVVCSNQRMTTAIAPILAAKKLNIPTVTFIFSWDNLPKATLVVETDYYFVWSVLMKEQLLSYYPFINESQVFITGSPQFEPHYTDFSIEELDAFKEAYGLHKNKKYICFSGDDETTSPDDPQYLKDLVESIKGLNDKGYDFGVIFRKCPVDFSGRYDYVLQEHSEIVQEIEPDWDKYDEGWNTIIPSKNDFSVLAKTVACSELVVNLGSSMVFDFAAQQKPCIYLNYNKEKQKRQNWDITKCYEYVHFRSMPKNAVGWLNNKEAITSTILEIFKNPKAIVSEANVWFDSINQAPQQNASERLVSAIKAIIKNQ